MPVNPPSWRNDTVLPLPNEVRATAWAVDAACSGNPGPMDYQCLDLQTGAQVFHYGPIHEKEIDLIPKMNDFATAVADAGNNSNPGGIANYCYELTKEFNQFYHDYCILNAESEAEKITRLVLAANVAKILKNGMSLLGIEVPDRM